MKATMIVTMLLVVLASVNVNASNYTTEQMTQVYSAPSESGQPVATIGYNKPCTVKRSSGWLYIETPDGVRGWVRESAIGWRADTAVPNNVAPEPRIQVGQTVSGQISLTDRAYTDRYYFFGEEGSQLLLRLVCDEQPLRVGIVGTNGINWQQWGPDRNQRRRRAEIGWVTLPQSGIYAVTVEGAAGNLGAYRVRLYDRANTLDPATRVERLERGKTISGNLAAGDPLYEDGRFYDVFSFQGAKNEQISLWLDSTIGGCLTVWGPGGFAAESRSFFNDSTSGFYDLTLPVEGEYRVCVTTNPRETWQTGPYRLRLDGRLAPQWGYPHGQRAVTPEGAVANIAYNTTVEDAIGNDDPILASGEHYKVYAFTATEGQYLRVIAKWLASENRMALVYFVVGPDGSYIGSGVMANAGTSSPDALVTRCPMAGRYLLYMVNEQPAAATYQLTVNNAPPASPARPGR